MEHTNTPGWHSAASRKGVTTVRGVILSGAKDLTHAKCFRLRFFAPPAAGSAQNDDLMARSDPYEKSSRDAKNLRFSSTDNPVCAGFGFALDVSRAQCTAGACPEPVEWVSPALPRVATLLARRVN